MGYTIGRWEGDTLVLEASSFNDFTCLGRGGFFHPDQMKVTERFRREGELRERGNCEVYGLEDIATQIRH